MCAAPRVCVVLPVSVVHAVVVQFLETIAPGAPAKYKQLREAEEARVAALSDEDYVSQFGVTRDGERVDAGEYAPGDEGEVDAAHEGGVDHHPLGHDGMEV